MPSNQILTVAQMQAAEQALIDGGETVSTLMERAGKGAAEWIWRLAAGRPVTVLCGPGNNGGDGYVIARVLAERGLTVRVIAPFSPKTPAARAAREAWGGTPAESAKGGVFVDCLFGSGLARALDQQLETRLCELAAAHDLGADADARLATETYDLVILDLSLARMDGLEVLRRLRGQDIGVVFQDFLDDGALLAQFGVDGVELRPAGRRIAVGEQPERIDDNKQR